ncbi:MAG: FAD-dependent oxidoreductase [Acidobacteria bacterium]|nr:MAG: FAD-dependent oxidoreductase [Acidobacteriota bacterium]
MSKSLSEVSKGFDIVVVGAGVFGAWTAHELVKAGKRVLLVDAHGPGNSRASSGGESRIIRMGYGADEVYTRWSARSLERWKSLFSAGYQNPPLFHQTGVLWMAREDDSYAEASVRTVQRLGIEFEKLSRAELDRRFPQVALGQTAWGFLEPGSGVLLARRAVAAVVAETVRAGGEFCLDAILPPDARASHVQDVRTRSGSSIQADVFVFACGPWLPKLFPDLLARRISPTRQEVFFIGVPSGEQRFSPPKLPTWIDFPEEVYGMPDIESRGLKVAFDRHGPPFDPDTGDRIVSRESIQAVKAFVARRFPALKGAPVVETRVCQYENTSNGDFLVDRHPDYQNVWLVGGGSGHGFKHGPAMGEYAAAQILGQGTAEPRFSLKTKGTVQKRTVY